MRRNDYLACKVGHGDELYVGPRSKRKPGRSG